MPLEIVGHMKYSRPWHVTMTGIFLHGFETEAEAKAFVAGYEEALNNLTSSDFYAEVARKLGVHPDVAKRRLYAAIYQGDADGR